MATDPSNIIALYARQDIPALGLRRGDMVMLDPDDNEIWTYRRLGPKSAVIAQSLMVWLDKGRLLTREVNAQTVYALLSRIAGQSPLHLVTDSPATPPDSLDALLARLETAALPEEPSAAYVTWQAHEREYRHLDDQDPSSGDEWKRGDK